VDTLPIVGQSYRPRLIDHVVSQGLAAAGAVLIEGARACGKTMTGLNAAESYVFVDDEASQQMRGIAPQALLDGGPPRLVDEWQLAPELWNMVRRRVDASPEPGLFILTGSSVPSDDVTRHTGAGRVLRLRQRTMTWLEKDEDIAAGGDDVSLADLFAGGRPTGGLDSPATLDDVLRRLVEPGFPGMVGRGASASRLLTRGYLDDVARLDLPRLIDMRRDPAAIARLLASIARNVSSEVSYTTLAADVGSVAPGISADTVRTYVDSLERLFVVEKQPAWTPRLRSRARLRTADKWHLADPCLAVVALGASAETLKRDLNTAGLLFESAVVHDLRVLGAPLGLDVRHFRDSNGREIDAVLTLPDGRWAALEVKLSGLQVAAGAASLAAAVNDVDSAAAGEPAFRLVVTGTGQTFTLDDGAITCPLSALRP
jgi:predicted AAA+ superfamily ATPase